MTALVLLDAAGRPRSPATLPGYHCGRAPHNKGPRYPADPPPVEENIAVMRRAGETAHSLRTRALIVLLSRAGLRVSEALALAESDLDRSRGVASLSCCNFAEAQVPGNGQFIFTLCGVRLLGDVWFGSLVSHALEALALELSEPDAVGRVRDVEVEHATPRLGDNAPTDRDATPSTYRLKKTNPTRAFLPPRRSR